MPKALNTVIGGEFSPAQKKTLLAVSTFACNFSKQTRTFKVMIFQCAAQTKLFTDRHIIKALCGELKQFDSKGQENLCEQTVTAEVWVPEADAKSSSLRSAANSPEATSQTKLFSQLV